MMYDQGGIIPSGLTTVRNDTGAPIPILKHPGEEFYTAEEVRRHGGAAMEQIQLSRGSVVMSRASLDAIGPDLLRRMVGGDPEIIVAEVALAELDAEEQRCVHGRCRIDACIGCERRYENGELVGPFEEER